MLKNNGPNIEPCGIPMVTAIFSDILSLYVTYWVKLILKQRL